MTFPPWEVQASLLTLVKLRHPGPAGDTSCDHSATHEPAHATGGGVRRLGGGG
ncbi:hypothetical protein [Nocardioides sp. HB32]